MTTTNYQKFQFLPPDEADFRKKMRVAVILFFIYLALFFASRQIRLGDSPSSEFFNTLCSMFPGFFVYGTYVAWQNFRERQYQVSHGHIEIDDQKLRIFTGKGTP